MVRGPANVIVRVVKRGEGETPGLRLDTPDNLSLSATGPPGKRGSRIRVQGVTLSPRITYRRLEVRIRRDSSGARVTVANGEVLLRDNEHTGALPGQLIRGPLARQ